MSKHESFKDQIIEVPLSNHEAAIIVQEPFWKSLRDQGVSLPFLHNNEPHVTDPRNNNRKVKLARLVMECEAGYTAKPKDPKRPFDLLPDCLEVVKDGRAKYPAFIGTKPPKRDWRQIHPDCIDPGEGNGPDIHADEDWFAGEEVFPVRFKDAEGLYGLGKSSSRRVKNIPPKEDEGDDERKVTADFTKKAVDVLFKAMSLDAGKILPTAGKTFKPFSRSFYNGNRVGRESQIKFTKRKGIPD